MRVIGTPHTPIPGSAAAVERPLPRHGHQRRRRQLALEGPRRHALARGRHLRPLGHVLLHPRRGERGVLVDRAPADGASARCTTRRYSPRSRAEFRRRDGDFESHTEIVVSPEDDIELRRLHVTNRSRTRRTIDVTSYAEVVLAPPAADALHPAFANLFVQTEIVAQRQAILCTRRPRSRGRAATVDVPPDGGARGRCRRRVLRDRPMHFIGRGRTVAAPRAMTRSRRLSGSEGSVLDPIVAIRHRVTLEPEQTATIDIASGVGRNARRRIGAGREVPGSASRRPRVRSGVDAQLGDAAPDQRHRVRRAALRRLASSVIYANASLRAEAGVLLRNRRGQSGLWSYAISGDLPIVLLQIARLGEHRPRAPPGAGARVLAAQGTGGRPRDLERGSRRLPASAAGPDHGADRRRRRSARHRSPGRHLRAPGGADRGRDRILLQSVARAIITDRRGSLVEQIARRGPAEVRVPRLVPSRIHRGEPLPAAPPSRDLILFNGLGGFTPDGSEYVITTVAGPGDAGAVGQRAGQPALRHGDFRERPRVHLGRERARVPPHAVAQRPGERCERGGVLPARRGDRPLLVADTAALPRHRRLRHPSRLRLQRVRARGGRHPLRADGVRGHRRAGEVLGAQDAQRIGPVAPALGHRLRGVGARRPAAEDGDARDHRDRARRAARCWRAMPTTPSSPTASPSSTSTTRRAA